MKNYLVEYKNECGNVMQIPVCAENEKMAISYANVRLFDICYNLGMPKYYYSNIITTL